MAQPNASEIFTTISTFCNDIAQYKPNVTETEQFIKNSLLELSDLFDDAAAYLVEPTVLQYQALTTQMDRIHKDFIDMAAHLPSDEQIQGMRHFTRYLQLELIYNLRETEAI